MPHQLPGLLYQLWTGQAIMRKSVMICEKQLKTKYLHWFIITFFSTKTILVQVKPLPRYCRLHWHENVPLSTWFAHTAFVWHGFDGHASITNCEKGDIYFAERCFLVLDSFFCLRTFLKFYCSKKIHLFSYLKSQPYYSYGQKRVFTLPLF